jgi:cobalt/nickel transport system permease protein
VAIGLIPIGAFWAIALLWLTIVVLAWSAHLGPWRTVRGAFIAVPFMTIALPLVLTRGAPYAAVLELGPLTLAISAEGLSQFLTIAAKSWVSVQAALLLTYTTPFHDLVDGLRALRLPRIMVAIISFMYRYLAVVGDEASRLNRARASRSADAGVGRAGGTLRWRGAVTGSMVGSLFLRSYERSERVYAAMQARGFDGELRYLPSPAPSMRARTVLVVALLALVAFEIAVHLAVARP